MSEIRNSPMNTQRREGGGSSRHVGTAMLMAWLTGAGSLLTLASLPAAAQTAPSTSLLQNGAVNNRANQPEYEFHRHNWGYNFYFGTEDQGTYSDGELHAWKVQGNVWMIVGLPDQANVVVHIGNDGVLVVDTGTAEMAPKLLELIKQLAARYAGDHKDIRWVINTTGAMEHVGGNEVIRNAGKQIVGISLGGADVPGATLVATENTLTSLVRSGAPNALWPSEAHVEPVYSWYFNDEAIALHQPRSANTNGNMLVQFRRADVIAVGDLVTYNAYPYIDVENGGSIDGLLTALHDVLDMCASSYHNGGAEGGTLIVPGHGRLIDRTELLHYIYMVQTLRNRIMYHKNRGRTLQAVLDMKVTADFDGRWGGNAGHRTPQDFARAIYETLPAGSSRQPDRFFIPAGNR